MMVYAPVSPLTMRLKRLRNDLFFVERDPGPTCINQAISQLTMRLINVEPRCGTASGSLMCVVIEYSRAI